MKRDKIKLKNGKLPILGVISRLFCLVNIHKPIDKKFDSEYWYTNKSCERCGCDVGFPKWKINAIPKNGL
jgi:hypothetical protein